jgi:hypothetical protein
MPSILMVCALTTACAGVLAGAIVATAPDAGTGHLRATQNEMTRPRNGTGWAHRNASAQTLVLPLDEIQRIHLAAETRRHEVQGCGVNQIIAAKDVYDRIMSKFLSSHLDYSCECLDASFKSSLYQHDGKMQVQGSGFEKTYDVPQGQEKAKLCEAMEYLSVFVSDTKCMAGSNVINNDNWQETLC